MYSILIEHPNISLLNIYEIEQGTVKKITFQDYYTLIVLSSLLNALINEAKYSYVKKWLKNKDCFKKNEQNLISILLEQWFHSSKFLISSEENIVKIKHSKISFSEYLSNLHFRGGN